jgi:hypothetical protein
LHNIRGAKEQRKGVKTKIKVAEIRTLHAELEPLADAHGWSQFVLRTGRRVVVSRTLARDTEGTGAKSPESLAAKSPRKRRAGPNLVDCTPSEAQASRGKR